MGKKMLETQQEKALGVPAQRLPWGKRTVSALRAELWCRSLL